MVESDRGGMELLPYRTFSSYLKRRYGCVVYKVALNAGLGCPNRDGTIGGAGCLFCDEFEAGHAPAVEEGQSIAEQFRRQVDTRRRIDSGHYRFMAYLQAGTGTHGDQDTLRSVYRQVRSLPEVVAVSISTRPDCVGESVLDLVAEAFAGLDVWIELGVQSAHDDTLAAIRRGHTFADVEDAVRRIRVRGFSVCAHLILGLPGEDADRVRETAARVTSLGVDAVKLHALYVAKGSGLEAQWRDGSFSPVTEADYVKLVADVLERLPESVVVQRLVGRGRPEVHLAPEWVRNTRRVQSLVIEEFERRGTRQGARV